MAGPKCIDSQNVYTEWQDMSIYSVTFLRTFDWSLHFFTYHLNVVLLQVVTGAAAPSVAGPPHSWGFQITHNEAPQSVGLLWRSDQLVAENPYLTAHNTHKRQTSVPTLGFEPTISASEWSQTYTLDLAATGTSSPTSVHKLIHQTICLTVETSGSARLFCSAVKGDCS
jgi:hypothetical protein